MAEYVRSASPPELVPAQTHFVVPLSLLEDILGRRLEPWESRRWEKYGYTLHAPCTCPQLEGVLAGVLCRNGHQLL